MLTHWLEVRNVTSLGRGPTAAQKVALLWEQPTCSVERCGRRARLEADHTTGAEYATTRHTRLDELDRLCDQHHDKKTYDGWGLVPGTGVRPMVPPEHPATPEALHFPSRTSQRETAMRTYDDTGSTTTSTTIRRRSTTTRSSPTSTTIGSARPTMSGNRPRRDLLMSCKAYNEVWLLDGDGAYVGCWTSRSVVRVRDLAADPSNLLAATRLAIAEVAHPHWLVFENREGSDGNPRPTEADVQAFLKAARSTRRRRPPSSMR